MKILNLGSMNIDYVYSLDHIVKPGETLKSLKFEIFPGGKGLNQSIAAAKGGGEVYHAGCLGYDGKILTDILRDSGVDISYIKQVDEKNGHAIIQVDSNGQNSIFIYPGSNEKITRDYIDMVLDNFSGGDLILLQNEISCVDYAVERAYEKGMEIIFNPSPFNEKIKSVDFNKITYLILNEIEAMELTETSNWEEALENIKKSFPNLKTVLTLGERGSVFSDSSGEIYCSAYDSKVVDTTAAGDTFTGYFAAGISRGEEYREILKNASLASAIAVSRHGAAPSIPRINEVYSAVAVLKEKNINQKEEIINKKIDDYIENNIKTANIGELAEILGYSAVYTGEIVKKMTGETFSKKLREARLEKARESIKAEDKAIGEIIKEVGYENESFFRKIFKEKYGKTPLELRKKINKK